MRRQLINYNQTNFKRFCFILDGVYLEISYNKGSRHFYIQGTFDKLLITTKSLESTEYKLLTLCGETFLVRVMDNDKTKLQVVNLIDLDKIRLKFNLANANQYQLLESLGATGFIFANYCVVITCISFKLLQNQDYKKTDLFSVTYETGFNNYNLTYNKDLLELRTATKEELVKNLLSYLDVLKNTDNNKKAYEVIGNRIIIHLNTFNNDILKILVYINLYMRPLFTKTLTFTYDSNLVLAL